MIFNRLQRGKICGAERMAALHGGADRCGSAAKSPHFGRKLLTGVLRSLTHSAVLAATLAGLSPTAAGASNPSPAARIYAAPVAEAAQRFGIPELWIWRVMHAESRGNRRAISHAGAMGLMQIMPGTWRMLTSKHRLGSDPYDVRANIHAGAAYLRAMWDRYRDVRLMLAAYNAGPGRADAFAAGRRGLPAETIAYVAAIAPELGGGARVSRAAAMSAPASGWRDAELFVARIDPVSVSADAAPLPVRVPSENTADAQMTAPDSLFVIVSGKDRR